MQEQLQEGCWQQAQEATEVLLVRAGAGLIMLGWRRSEEGAEEGRHEVQWDREEEVEVARG